MGFIDTNKIPREARGILYINKYDAEKETLTPIKYILYSCPMVTLEAYSNTRNPESEMASGSTHDEFLIDLANLHRRMKDPRYLHELKEYL